MIQIKPNTKKNKERLIWKRKSVLERKEKQCLQDKHIRLEPSRAKQCLHANQTIKTNQNACSHAKLNNNTCLKTKGGVHTIVESPNTRLKPCRT
jgi:hypothetical protein